MKKHLKNAQTLLKCCQSGENFAKSGHTGSDVSRKYYEPRKKHFLPKNICPFRMFCTFVQLWWIGITANLYNSDGWSTPVAN